MDAGFHGGAGNAALLGACAIVLALAGCATPAPVVVKVPTVAPEAWFSGTVLGERAMSVGGELIASACVPELLANWVGDVSPA